MAVVSERVTADVVEVSEFPAIAQKFGVRGVPKIVINDKVSFEGALPEPLFLEQVLSAVGPESEDAADSGADDGTGS